jgi:glyceraldehyde 3-phosphate dehydrogenase
MVRIAINGLGRIGRVAFKRILDYHPRLELVAVNDLTPPENLVYLLKHDSVYPGFSKEIKIEGNDFVIGKKRIKVLSEPNPEKLPWKELGIDIVLECTGRFTKLEDSEKHLKAGAKKVIISANSKTPSVPHFVLGVNEQNYDPNKDHVLANCSCTTNCAVPVLKALNQNFGILMAQMTTVHAVTSTQNLVDGPNKDWRRGRSAFSNIVPTTTGAAKAVIRVLPELENKISGSAFRVPVISGSILEVVARVDKEVDIETINKVFEKEAKSDLKGILAVSRESLVSSDIVGTCHSAIVDLSLTEVIDRLVKVVAWYDNEWAYGCRLVELAEYVGKRVNEQ